MAEDMARKLQAIDSAILTDVVRQDQRSPLFEVTGWSVRRLSDKGVTNPDGLWLFVARDMTTRAHEPGQLC
jgi:hypothetical protein